MGSEYDPQKNTEHQAQVLGSTAWIVCDRGKGEHGRFVIGSGFVAEVDELWLFITASHVLKNFHEHADERRRGAFSLSFPVVKTTIPLDPSRVRGLGIEMVADLMERGQIDHGELSDSDINDLRHVDIGWFAIPDDDRNRLSASGLEPLTETNLRFLEESQVGDVDGDSLDMFIFGLPGSSKRPAPTWDEPDADFKVLRVHPNGDEGFRVFLKPGWKEEEHVGSIAGMSGGPIAILGWHEPIVVGVISDEFAPIAVASVPGAVSPESPALADMTIIGFQIGKVLHLLKSLNMTLPPVSASRRI